MTLKFFTITNMQIIFNNYNHQTNFQKHTEVVVSTVSKFVFHQFDIIHRRMCQIMMVSITSNNNSTLPCEI